MMRLKRELKTFAVIVAAAAVVLGLAVLADWLGWGVGPHV